MIDGLMRLSLTLFFAVLLMAMSAAAETTVLSIGYLEITDDARYEEKRAYARIRVRPHDRPRPGAEMALRESRILGRALKIQFSLEHAEARSVAGLVSEIQRMAEKGVRYFLIDADAAVITAVGAATAGENILLFNISEPANILRGAGCLANVMHVLPSHAMMTDALAQFLVARKWREILVLKGPDSEDAAFATAFETSAKRFGVRVTASRDFVLGNDPREREKNNVGLMTGDSDYDAVFVADTEGEFGRTVPYQTYHPRPVIGTEGLVAEAWHWAWERHGAPQLNQRFEKLAKRRMTGTDWAAWAAIKAVVEAAVRTKPANFKAVRTYLVGEKMTLDVYKGNPVSFRSWNNQLRQPILLRTHNAVIARAPIKGFLHPTENMDTLGYDRGDRKCKFKGSG
ncbi:MAG: ABC transporter substrate-binding protein [Rhodospirillales bacterium]|nr:ABC transporter substrate-binding protein [Rhodospirillales bacterium]